MRDIHPTLRPRALTLLIGAGLLAACSQPLTRTAATVPSAPSATLDAQAARALDLGPNVKIFDPSMSVDDIQAAVNAISTQQVSNQFGDQRYALLFKPGTYGTPDHPLIIQVGYYTEVAGLGASPNDVTINGHVDVYNQCDPTGCIALNNFWRSVSNLTINVAGQSGCYASGDFWAVSQAAPMRRVNVTGGNLTLMDYCTGPSYASGGFISDSKASTIINGSQQQFLLRNSSVVNWTNGVWNQVFAGVDGAPATSFGQPAAQPYTTLASTPVSREKPYLTTDAQGNLSVFVPAAQTNSQGISWANGQAAGRNIPLSSFYVAKPSDSALALNVQLALGRHLLFTPGVYRLNVPLLVTRQDTVLLGLGVATLTPQTGLPAAIVTDNAFGVNIAGLMIDAGPINSPVLLQVGTRLPLGIRRSAHSDDGASAADPITLSDVFFRIGGAKVGKATTSLEVNADHVILDDIWAWRADHGNPGTVGWTVNTADHGLVVNGNDVTATALFVEHFQKEQVVWNGERGQTIMFQNEMPYDPPNQAAWQHGSVLGYAAYKVGDGVKTHQGWGMGSYIFTNVDPTIHASHGFEVPVTPGVQLHSLLTVSLAAGTIDHVVNSTGAPVTPTDGVKPSDVVSFP